MVPGSRTCRCSWRARGSPAGSPGADRPLCAYLPGVAFLTRLDPLSRPLLYLAAAPLVGASFVVLLTTGVVILKWLLVGRVRTGTYPVHGRFYVRKWIVDRLLAISLDVVGSL